MFTLLKDQMAQNQQLMERMLQAQIAQAEVLSSWIGMFKQPAEPLPSSSADERAERQALAETSQWEPLTTQEMLSVLTGNPHG